MKARMCMGFGATEGKCSKLAEKNRRNGGYWCAECNEERIAAVGRDLEALKAGWLQRHHRS